MAGKICLKCGIEKPLTAYHIDRHKPDGRRPRCRQCTNANSRNWNSHNVETLRDNHCRRHGIRLEEKKQQWENQNRQCALCRRDKHYTQLTIDHSHECPQETFHRKSTRTGIESWQRWGCKYCIRGLLCSFCNRWHLPFLEKRSYLQSDFVKNYLQQRPFRSSK